MSSGIKPSKWESLWGRSIVGWCHYRSKLLKIGSRAFVLYYGVKLLEVKPSWFKTIVSQAIIGQAIICQAIVGQTIISWAI